MTLSPKKRALVIDDDNFNQKIGASHLTKLGFEVRAVAHGRDGISEAQKADYELILLDLRMPGMDGYETARQIRSLERGQRHVPILAWSAFDADDARTAVLDAGMDGFIDKSDSATLLPIVVEDLLKKNESTPGKTEKAKILLTTYVETLNKQLDKLQHASDMENSDSLLKSAQSIKNTSLAIGAKKIFEASKSIELAAAMDELDDIPVKIKELRALVPPTLADLEKIEIED